MDGFIAILGFGVLALVLILPTIVTLRQNKELDDFLKQQEVERQTLQEACAATKPFIEQIDIAIGEYSKYEIIHKLREETII